MKKLLHQKTFMTALQKQLTNLKMVAMGFIIGNLLTQTAMFRQLFLVGQKMTTMTMAQINVILLDTMSPQKLLFNLITV